MYIPKQFKVTDKEEIFSFIERNAFGQLISNSGGRLFSTHIPFLLSEDKTKILGHLAKQNPQLSDLDGQEVLFTLQGAHGYISPSWYSAPGVPTWNYQAVHIYGRATISSNANQLQMVVDKLTEKYESNFEKPWKTKYKSSMLGAITGVDITITEIQCKYKLSQNRSSQDQLNVIENLKSQGSDSLAEVIKINCV